MIPKMKLKVSDIQRFLVVGSTLHDSIRTQNQENVGKSHEFDDKNSSSSSGTSRKKQEKLQNVAILKPLAACFCVQLSCFLHAIMPHPMKITT